MITFSWDPKKSQANVRKHGVTFEEAKSVFQDESARLIHDTEHSEDETRFILLGLSSILNCLVVCHCYRENDEEIRIISARKATRNEEQYYWREK